MRWMLSILQVISCLSVTLIFSGCATFGGGGYSPVAEPQFVRGEPHDLVDIAGNVLSIPSKVLLWDRRVDNHDISLGTESAIRDYVATNGLDNTKVRFNQYDPMDEWKRLVRNKSISPLARYTAGTIQTLGYTIFPGRLFGGDKYNPYTDTLSVYSDVPSLGMVEAAYAKNLRSRKHRGWYAIGQEFPILGMHHEGKATEDILNYLAIQGEPFQQMEGYELLYPRLAGAWGESIGGFVNGGSIGRVAGSLVGHLTGRHKSQELVDTMGPYAGSHAFENARRSESVMARGQSPEVAR